MNPHLLLVFGLLFGVALGDLRINKKDLPQILDVSSRAVFTQFPGTLCRAEMNPQTSFLTATPVHCSTKAKSSLLPGGFSNTTCFSLQAIAATYAQLKVTCSSDDWRQQAVQAVAVTIVDSAPKCRNTTVSISPEGAKFFLRADDLDDTDIFFHVRNRSLTQLKGILKYCAGCNGDQEGSSTDSANWKNYSSLFEGNVTQHTFSRMFSYSVSFNKSEQYHEVLYYSARDISDLECPTDGEIHFVSAKVTQPTIAAEPSQVTAFLNRPQTFMIVGGGDATRLSFVIKVVPPAECALLCRVPEGARTLLRDYPSVQLSGSVLGPCSELNALKADDDVTLISSTKETFFLQTFLVVLVKKTCPVASFTAVAVANGVESTPKSFEIISKNITQQCKPFSETFQISEPFKFKVEQFVSTPGPFRVTLLTKDPSFVLQAGGADVDSSSLTFDSTLVFVGKRPIKLSLMVEASNPPWTGFCLLGFSTGIPSTMSLTTVAPSTSPPTTAQPQESSPPESLTTNQEKPFNYTVLLFFFVVVLIVVYFFRESVFRAFFVKKNAHTGRKYGVAPTSDEI